MKKILGLIISAGIFISANANEVKYNKELSQYSLFKTDKEGYKEYLTEKKIEPAILKQLYNKKDNPKGIVISAYAYDYGYGRTDLAEPYYELFTKTPKIGFEDKLRYIDYLLRTGRINNVEEHLKSTDCSINFKHAGKCFYYLGIVKYLKTGDNKNTYLNLAKNTEEKAKEIYFLREKEKEKK